MTMDYNRGRYECDHEDCTRTIRPDAAGIRNWRTITFEQTGDENGGGSLVHLCPEHSEQARQTLKRWIEGNERTEVGP